MMLLKDIIDIPEKYHHIPIDFITNDSREVIQNTLFIALQGAVSDGKNYINDAINNGAVAILVDDQHVKSNTNIPIIFIENLNHQQSSIAARFYDNPSTKVRVIGVTGTNGKTSVTHFLAQSLPQCAVIGTTGYGFLPTLTPTLNTTPDPIRLSRMLHECVMQGAKTVAMEVSSHALAQHRCDHIVFHTAVFTNLTHEHLDFHGTMENYRDAKFLLFQHPGLQHAVINIDSETGVYYARHLPRGIHLLTYSVDNNRADIRAIAFEPNDSGFTLQLQLQGIEARVAFNLIGHFNAENVLALIGVLMCVDMRTDYIVHALKKLSPVPGRMNILTRDNQPSVVIDYAHTPDALDNVLRALRLHCNGALWCVFGCGGNRDKTKRPIMGKIADTLCDHVVITNDNPRHESPESITQDILKGIKNNSKTTVILDREKAIQHAFNNATADDWIVIAGKGHETAQIIGNATLHHSDSEVVQALLTRIK